MYISRPCVLYRNGNIGIYIDRISRAYRYLDSAKLEKIFLVSNLYEMLLAFAIRWQMTNSHPLLTINTIRDNQVHYAPVIIIFLIFQLFIRNYAISDLYSCNYIAT